MSYLILWLKKNEHLFLPHYNVDARYLVETKMLMMFFTQLKKTH